MLSLFTLFFLLQDGDKAWAWLLRPASEWRRATLEKAGHDTLLQVGGYLRGSSVNAAVDALTDFVFLLILGVPLAGPLAVLVFFAGFVPYVGNFLATLTLVLLTFASGGIVAVVDPAGPDRRHERGQAPTPLAAHLRQDGQSPPRGHPDRLADRSGARWRRRPVPRGPGRGVPAGDLGGRGIGPQRRTGAGERPACRAGKRSPHGSTASPSGAGGCSSCSDWAGSRSRPRPTVPLVVGPMTVAIILAATLLPAVRILMRRGWTRGRASIVVAVVAWAVVVVFTVLSVIVLAKQGTEIVTTSTKGSSALAGVDWPSAIASGLGAASWRRSRTC